MLDFAIVMNKYARVAIEDFTNIGGLFKDLECELHTLTIAMQTFIAIFDEIAKIEDVVNLHLKTLSSHLLLLFSQH